MNEVVLIGAGAGLLALVGLLGLGVVSSSPPTAARGPSPAPAHPSPSAPARSQAPVDQGPQSGPVTLDHARRVAWQIVSVFETGRPEGRYDAFVILPDGAGISAGKKQGTDRSDVFDAIINGYIAAGGEHADAMRAYVGRLQRNESTLVDPNQWPSWVFALRDLFVDAADEPIMQRVQDDVFDRMFWQPTVAMVRELGLRTPLAYAVVFDTFIHSGPRGVGWMRRRFAAKPPSEGGDERIWLRDYVHARRRWLATHDKTALHATVYRMDLFIKLIREGNWALRTPFTIDRPRATIR